MNAPKLPKPTLSPPVQYIYSVFMALDLQASALTGGRPDETISARLGAAKEHGSVVWTTVANALNWTVLKLFGTPGHVEDAINAYRLRQAAAPSP